jgi:hypothetical protein
MKKSATKASKLPDLKKETLKNLTVSSGLKAGMRAECGVWTNCRTSGVTTVP